MFYIYSYKSPSEKYYIGVTNNKTRRRQEHRKKKKDCFSEKFAKAIQKYGFDNLEYAVIDSAETIEEAKELEIKYIEQYNSYKKGYNSTLGGDLCITRGKLTEEEILEIRNLLIENKLLIKDIACIYNVTSGTISQIKNNQRWKHLKGAKTVNRENKMRKGSQNGSAKLNEEVVKNIKLDLSKGISRKEIREKYEVSKTNLSLIATGKAWSHVEVPEYTYKKVRNGNAKLDEDKVRLIWKDRQEGLTQKDLYEKYEVSRSTIQNLLKGKIWKDIYEEMN